MLRPTGKADVGTFRSGMGDRDEAERGLGPTAQPRLQHRRAGLARRFGSAWLRAD